MQAQVSLSLFSLCQSPAPFWSFSRVLHGILKWVGVQSMAESMSMSEKNVYESPREASCPLVPVVQLGHLYASQYYFVLQRFQNVLPRATLYYKACKACFPVLPCTTKLASTSSYCKACRKYFPGLLCTAKLAERTSQHSFVLQRFQNVLPRTTLYYKACRTCFPVLLCTTRLAERAFQYYPVLQSLQNVLPSTTELGESTSQYYKACRTYCPVQLCAAKLADVIPSTT